eukprot:scaffold90814_cov22-Tisochrysis_lutea.AAC.1
MKPSYMYALLVRREPPVLPSIWRAEPKTEPPLLDDGTSSSRLPRWRWLADCTCRLPRWRDGVE